MEARLDTNLARHVWRLQVTSNSTQYSVLSMPTVTCMRLNRMRGACVRLYEVIRSMHRANRLTWSNYRLGIASGSMSAAAAADRRRSDTDS